MHAMPPAIGQADPTPAVGQCVQFHYPCSTNPDKTKNYEVGLKESFLDGKLTADVSIFRIDWDGIQTSITTSVGKTVLGYAINAGRPAARCRGRVDRETVAGFSVTFDGAYMKAALSKDIPDGAGLVGFKGDLLPGAPLFEGNLGVEQRFIVANHQAYAGADFGYVGDRKDNFQGRDTVTQLPIPRFDLPSYTKLDLHAGIDIDAWRVNFFINNVTDERGVVVRSAG